MVARNLGRENVSYFPRHKAVKSATQEGYYYSPCESCHSPKQIFRNVMCYLIWEAYCIADTKFSNGFHAQVRCSQFHEQLHFNIVGYWTAGK
jgi:hypothetical protein